MRPSGRAKNFVPVVYTNTSSLGGGSQDPSPGLLLVSPYASATKVRLCDFSQVSEPLGELVLSFLNNSNNFCPTT